MKYNNLLYQYNTTNGTKTTEVDYAGRGRNMTGSTQTAVGSFKENSENTVHHVSYKDEVLVGETSMLSPVNPPP